MSRLKALAQPVTFAKRAFLSSLDFFQKIIAVRISMLSVIPVPPAPAPEQTEKKHDAEKPVAVNTQARTFPPLHLETTAFTRKQLVHPEARQIALAGRSNVGKSSLVNALAGRKALAKVSATPGKTRSINYYRIGETHTYLVDLPGYGFARCSQTERKAWGDLLQFYCTHTPGLQGLVLLLDARLQPQKTDIELVAFAGRLALPLVGVLTKADKCSKKELTATMRSWEPLLGGSSLLTSSARSRKGLESVWESILTLLSSD